MALRQGRPNPQLGMASQDNDSEFAIENGMVISNNYILLGLVNQLTLVLTNSLLRKIPIFGEYFPIETW